MARLVLKLAGYPWDHITPLLTGDVVPEGIDLQYDVHHGLGPVADDPSCAGGEASLGRFMIETSRGNRLFVGLPIFPMFAFRHRCFLVKRGTTIGDLSALEGKRVGLDGWPNSGNTWTRVMLRQSGVDIGEITWVIAPIEGPAEARHGHVPPEAPSNVQGGPTGKSLVELLLAELAETAALFGDDWQPYGLEPNLKMLSDFCQDQCEQKLVGVPVNPVAAFADSMSLAR